MTIGRDETEAPMMPKNWDRWVSAAYLRLLGLSRKAIAKGGHVSAAALRKWEAHPFWPLAMDEARDRFLARADSRARTAILDALEGGDAWLGLKLLERSDPRLAPPKQRVEVDANVESVVFYIPDNSRDPDLQVSASKAKQLGSGNGNGRPAGADVEKTPP